MTTARRAPRLEALPQLAPRRPGTCAAGEVGPGPDQRVARRSAPSSAFRPAPLPLALVGLRVVVVDDEPDTAEVFAAALMACGAAVSAATNASDALRLVVEIRPHVVVSDIAMPGGDGYWLLGEIRRCADASVRSVPVVAATAYGREHSRPRALAAGFVELLQKPLDPEILCRAVARAAGR
jgi:CheY-like chemotaxis protein